MTCWVKSSSAFASENEIGLEGTRDLRGGRCPLQRSARTPPMDAWAFACDGLWKIPGRRSRDRKSTRLNSSHGYISYAVFCLKKKNTLHKPCTLRSDSRLLNRCVCR